MNKTTELGGIVFNKKPNSIVANPNSIGGRMAFEFFQIRDLSQFFRGFHLLDGLQNSIEQGLAVNFIQVAAETSRVNCLHRF